MPGPASSIGKALAYYTSNLTLNTGGTSFALVAKKCAKKLVVINCHGSMRFSFKYCPEWKTYLEYSNGSIVVEGAIGQSLNWMSWTGWTRPTRWRATI